MLFRRTSSIFSSSKIKVVLSENVKGSGYNKGEVLEVSKGYARNFLFPRSLALYATKDNVARFEEDRNKIDYEARELAQQRARARKRLGKIVVDFKRHILGTGANTAALHAPVNKSAVAEKLWKQQKIRIDPDDVHMPNGVVNSIGKHTVDVDFEGDKVDLQILVNQR